MGSRPRGWSSGLCAPPEGFGLRGRALRHHDHAGRRYYLVVWAASWCREAHVAGAPAVLCHWQSLGHASPPRSGAGGSGVTAAVGAALAREADPPPFQVPTASSGWGVAQVLAHNDHRGRRYYCVMWERSWTEAARVVTPIALQRYWQGQGHASPPPIGAGSSGEAAAAAAAAPGRRPSARSGNRD